MIDNRQGIGNNIGMNTEQVAVGIAVEDWAATPKSVQLWVAVLLETIERLQQRITGLEERVNQNSSNSSCLRRRIRSGRQRGGKARRRDENEADSQGIKGRPAP